MPDYDQHARRGLHVCSLAARMGRSGGEKTLPARPLYRAEQFYARHETMVK